MLANGLSGLNSFLALMIIVGTAGTVAYLMSEALGPGGFVAGIVVGGMAGLLLAIMVCGLLALVVSIHENLQEIRNMIEEHGNTKQQLAPEPEKEPAPEISAIPNTPEHVATETVNDRLDQDPESESSSG